jgi:hypothetical protein
VANYSKLLSKLPAKFVSRELSSTRSREWRFLGFIKGDRNRAIKYLEYGLELATKLGRTLAADRFRVAIENYRSGHAQFPDNLRAPNTSSKRPSKTMHFLHVAQARSEPVAMRSYAPPAQFSQASTKSSPNLCT